MSGYAQMGAPQGQPQQRFDPMTGKPIQNQPQQVAPGYYAPPANNAGGFPAQGQPAPQFQQVCMGLYVLGAWCGGAQSRFRQGERLAVGLI